MAMWVLPRLAAWNSVLPVICYSAGSKYGEVNLCYSVLWQNALPVFVDGSHTQCHEWWRANTGPIARNKQTWWMRALFNLSLKLCTILGESHQYSSLQTAPLWCMKVLSNTLKYSTCSLVPRPSRAFQHSSLFYLYAQFLFMQSCFCPPTTK